MPDLKRVTAIFEINHKDNLHHATGQPAVDGASSWRRTAPMPLGLHHLVKVLYYEGFVMSCSSL
jgi:hypothetical protein